MKKLIFPLLALLAFSACKKDSANTNTNNNNSQGTANDSWTFTEGGVVHTGTFDGGLLGSIFNTYNQSDTTFTFTMLGQDNSTGDFLNIQLSLRDSAFGLETYTSGLVPFVDSVNSFYYTPLPGGTNIYASSSYLSNTDQGAVMYYHIGSFNRTTNKIVITFTGQAKNAQGNNVNITNGSATCIIQRI